MTDEVARRLAEENRLRWVAEAAENERLRETIRKIRELSLTDAEIEAAYAALVDSLHPTEPIPFTKEGVRAALEAAAHVRASGQERSEGK